MLETLNTIWAIISIAGDIGMKNVVRGLKATQNFQSGTQNGKAILSTNRLDMRYFPKDLDQNCGVLEVVTMLSIPFRP